MECREPRQPWNQCRVPLLPSLPCSIGRTKPFRPHRNLNLSQTVHEAKSQLWNHMESTLIPTKYTKRTTTTMIIVTMVILKINNRFENRFNCISVMERSYVSVVSCNNRQRVQTRSLVFVFYIHCETLFSRIWLSYCHRQKWSEMHSLTRESVWRGSLFGKYVQK